MTAPLTNITTTTTAGTTAGTQTIEKDEIWSTILTGVASSKMVPTKKILVLGDPGSGKSTLIHYLRNDPGPQVQQNENDEVPTQNSFGINTNYIPLSVDNLDDEATNTLALSYNFIDVQDEENEAIARLGVYQLGLSAEEYMPLLKFALSTDTLADSAVIIALDWTRPWKFLENLERWVGVLQRRIDEICKEGTAADSTWSKGKAVVDELREKVEHYLQVYTEPVPVNTFNVTASTSTSSVPSTPTTFVTTPLVTTTTAADQVTLPLTQGSLTTNLGIPIIVVCCKSDALNMLEQTQDYKDEQFDFIQQTLRCICMKFGASLFYTSTLQPFTFHNLRQYILHRLLATSTKSYPFNLKAQVVERDTVLVPSGWDSWGKLRVLREGFDCEAVHQGWESDMDALTDRQQPGSYGARGVYEEVIADPALEEQPLNNAPPPVTCEDEQAFFERHFETLQRATELPNRQGTGANAKPSVVGPLGFTTNAIDLVRTSEDRLSDAVKNANPATTTSSNTSSALPTSETGSVNPVNPNQPSGPSHEVLANFFQSLLSKKASAGGSSTSAASLLSGSLGSGVGGATGATGNSTGTAATLTTSSSSTTAATGAGGAGSTGSGGNNGLLESIDESTTNSSLSSGTARRSTVSRKEVHKELDRMKQYVSKPQ